MGTAPSYQRGRTVSFARELVASYGRAFLTLKEAGEILGIPESTLRNQLSGGVLEVPTVKVGYFRRVPADSLIEYLESKWASAEPGELA